MTSGGVPARECYDRRRRQPDQPRTEQEQRGGFDPKPENQLGELTAAGGGFASLAEGIEVYHRPSRLTASLGAKPSGPRP